MTTNIRDAFEEFQRVYTTLDPELSKKALISTENLIDNIDSFSSSGFVDLHKKINLSYGSFIRGTKIPLLDDIDLFIGINGDGCRYDTSALWDNVTISVAPWLEDLTPLCHEGSFRLNSKKVVNRFVSKLGEVGDYKKADISRNMQACKLELSSYPWNFDIVPGFLTKSPIGGQNFYLIPNGYGNWMKTNPRVDQARLDAVVLRHGQAALKVIRLAKYWQRNNGTPKMPSYLVEKMAVDYLEGLVNPIPFYAYKTLGGLLEYIAKNILAPIPDAASIEPNLNHLSDEQRKLIAAMAVEHAERIHKAAVLESHGDQKACIETWGDVLGSSFPKFN